MGIILNENQICDILNNQKQYFKKGYTKEYSFRKKQLKKLYRMIDDNSEKIVSALYEDYKKPETETYLTEIIWLLHEIEYSIKKLKKWIKPKKVKTSLINFPSKSYIVKEPYGVSLIISPWNYPIQLTFTPLVGAIAAGNCVVIKPSEFVPNTSSLFDKLISNYFSKEYLTVVQGEVKESRILLESNFDYIFFTGSPTVGKIVMEKAAKHLTPVTLELGGKSPCIVDENVNMKITSHRIVLGKFTNAGQTCIAPDYLYVHKNVKDDLINSLIETITDFFGEDTEKSNEYSRIINEKHFDRLKSYLNNSNVIYGGKTNAVTRYISPTLILNPDKNNDVMCEEIFGPVLPIIEYENAEDLIDEIKNKPKPLAMYVFSKNKSFCKTILHDTSSGAVCINGTISYFLSDQLPFGGVGKSGMGNYHRKHSFETFSNAKSVMKKSFNFELKMKYPPYSKKLNFIRKIFKWLA